MVILLWGVLFTPFSVHAARCTGSPTCGVCTDCSRCDYCKNGGGTCGVCSPQVVPQSYHPYNSPGPGGFWQFVGYIFIAICFIPFLMPVFILLYGIKEWLFSSPYIYITKCQNCEGEIEHSLQQFNKVVGCPHCHQNTTLPYKGSRPKNRK